MENTLKEHQQIYDLIAAGDASGVYDTEFLSVPLCLGIDAVARDARHVLDYSPSFANQPVE